jgi:hypothetical protein
MADDTYPRSTRGGYSFSRGNPSSDAASRSPSNSDPLAELARLIGQTDPFGEAARLQQPQQQPKQRQAEDVWSTRRAPVPNDPPRYDDDFGSPLPPLRNNEFNFPPRRASDFRLDRPLPPDPAFDTPPAAAVAERDLGLDQGYAAEPAMPDIRATAPDYGAPPVGPYYGDNGQLSSQDPYAQDDHRYDVAPRRRSGLLTVVAVLSLAFVGTAGAYAYRNMFNGSGPAFPPLIKADPTPNKVMPASAGEGTGTKQFNDRLIGDRSPSERVVPREEQPVDVRATAPRPAAGFANAQGGAPPVVAGTQPTVGGWPAPAGTMPSSGSAAPAGAASSGSPNEPRRIRTVTVRADQGLNAQQQAAPPPPVSQPQQARRPAQQPVQSVQTAQSPTSGPIALAPGGDDVQRQAALAPPRAAAPRAPATAGGGNFVVQVSAQRSEAEASASYRSIQSRHPQILGNRQAMIRRKDVAGQGTFYGAQVGPFASREEAVQLCEQLKSAGGNCMVQRN